MHYDELTKRLFTYLCGDKRTNRPALIDPYEHGKMNVSGQPKPINIKWQIADKQIGKPQKCTKTIIARHLAHESKLDTFYYRSSRRSRDQDWCGFALLMIDIDAHNGETDAQQVAEVVEQDYLPGAYFEPSTGGKGRHLYAVVAFDKYAKRQQINGWLKSAGISLRELMRERGFKAKIDHLPLRTFSVFRKDTSGKTIPVCMGHLAKMPRPRTLEDMTRLESAPIYRPEAITKIIDEWKAIREARQPRSTTKKTAVIDPPVPRIKQEATRKAAGAFKGMQPDDPRSRSVHSVMALARQLGRLPTRDEAYLFYMQADLATIPQSGDLPRDTSRRLRRLENAILHVEKTFDVGRAGHGFNRESLLPLVQKHVTEEHRKSTKYQAQITDEDLAIALHVIEQATFERTEDRDRQWGCPVNRIVGMFRKLGEKKLEEMNNNTSVSRDQKPRGCNRNKATALKQILILAGLAEVVDDSYRIGTESRLKKNNNTSVSRDREVSEAWGKVGDFGRGKRICIGPNHPRSKEWERDYELLWEWVLTGRKSEIKAGVESILS